jgi:two-component system invasion response regulator UvrY
MSKLGEKNPFVELTDREKEVMDFLLKGAMVKEISISLSIKSNTVSTYKKLIYYKIGVDNNIDLFKLAQKFKVIK